MTVQTKNCFAGVNIYLVKKMTREYRLVRDFNFSILDEVSQSVLVLRCTRTDTFVYNIKQIQTLTFLLLLLRCSEFVLESYLVHDHVLKYDDAS